MYVGCFRLNITFTRIKHREILCFNNTQSRMIKNNFIITFHSLFYGKHKRDTKTLTPLSKNKHGFLNIMSMCSKNIKLQI